MPHIIVEHTKNIANIEGLLQSLHSCLCEKDTLVLNDLKTRALKIDNAIVGDGKHDAMVHIILKLMPGRNDELINNMTQSLQETAIDHCNDMTRITVESVTLQSASYRN